MSWWQRVMRRVIGRAYANADLDREIRAHLEEEADEQRAAGASAAEARDAARRAFGSVTLTKEDTRATWRFAAVERIWHDAAYAQRLMRKSPGFTAVVVLSLALGIGANSAIFSVMDAVLLKPLPVKHPEELYLLQPSGSKGTGAFSFPGFDAVRRVNQVFSETFTFNEGDEWNVIINGNAELTSGALVTGNYFAALGVGAMAGRVLAEGDESPSAAPVAVISYRYWQRRLGRDASAIGAVISVNGAPVTVVGVAPPKFSGLWVGYPVDIWLPMTLEPRTTTGASALTNNNTWWLLGMGRLKPGVTEAQARANLEVVTPMVRQTMGIAEKSAAGRFARIEMIPGATGLSPLQQEFSLPLRILMITVGLVLLIACANVANLLLSRASARRREMAIRLALGGGRKRLIQQLLVESLMLATIAGAIGLLLAWWSKKALVEFFMTQRVGFALDLALDRRVLMFTVGISLLTGILFGLAPALRATRLDPGETLKEQARSASGGRVRRSLSQALIVLQVAVSLVLLADAGLFLRTLQNLRHSDLGFNPDHVLLMTIEPKLGGYTGDRLAQLYSAVLARFSATPGVRTASAMRFGMINGGYSGRGMFLPGDAPGQDASAAKDRSVAFNIVGPRFFETMGIALTGREFRESDTATSPKVAIVNEKLARYYFGTDAVIGQRIGFDAKSPDEFEIIGVAHDTKYWRMRYKSPASAFVSVFQSGTLVGLERMTIAVRTVSDPAGMAGTLQRGMQSIAADVPIRSVRTQEAQIDAALGRERLLATLSTLFGGLALGLACVGLYGVLSYAVVRRTMEIGIRMALGARGGDVVRMILRDSAWLVGGGLAIGLIAAMLSARFVQSQLFQLQPTDPATFALACLVLIGAATLAASVPAWRAARVDPMVALRYE